MEECRIFPFLLEISPEYVQMTFLKIKPEKDLWALLFSKCKSVFNLGKFFNLKTEVTKLVKCSLFLKIIITTPTFSSYICWPWKKDRKQFSKFSFRPSKS